MKNKVKILIPETMRANFEASLDQIRDLLWSAIQEKYGEKAWVQEVYPSSLIYQMEGENYKLAWSLLDGKIQLGSESVKVERTWVEVRVGQAVLDEGFATMMRLGDSLDREGSSWDVVICEPGHTLNGWYLPEDVLRASAGMFDKVDVCIYESSRGASHVPDQIFDLKSLLVKNKVGWIDQVKYVAGRGLMGVLHFLDSAKWMGRNILDAMQRGGSSYGLSWDAPVRAAQEVIDGKTVLKLLKFTAVDSVDIVTRPAAGGKFTRAVASMPAQDREDLMKKRIWDLLHSKRPDLLNGKTFDAISEQELEGLARMAMTPEDKNKDDVKILRCEMALDRKLGSSGLPEIAQARIRKSFAGRAFEESELEASITDEKDYLAKMAQPAGGDAAVVAASSIHVGISSYEKACIALDRTFGLAKDDILGMASLQRLDGQPFFADVRSIQDVQDFDQVPAFTSLRDMYNFFTGDYELTGRINRKRIPKDILARMEITTGTFTFVLGNTLGRRLVKDYREADFGENLIISTAKPVKDYRTQEAVLVGGFGDPDDVDPEAADYQEIAAVTDEEVSYIISTFKGNILTITEKTIRNDDISVVQRLIQNLGRALRRAHAKYVWNFLTANGNCTDGTAMFTGPHGNLGAAALAFATAQIAYSAIAGFTEKDSGEPLGLLDDPSIKPTLFYPVGLMATGESIVNDDFYYTGAADLTTKTRNALKGKINGKMCSLFTDANDWYLLLPANVVDIIEMGYMDGRREPEFFLADSPQSETVFVADKIRYKFRHRYAGHSVDYRAGYKAVV